MDLEMRFEARRRWISVSSAREARPGRVMIAWPPSSRAVSSTNTASGSSGKFGQADDFEAGVDQRTLIGGVLRRGLRIVDRVRSSWVSAHAGSRGLTVLVNARAISAERGAAWQRS